MIDHDPRRDDPRRDDPGSLLPPLGFVVAFLVAVFVALALAGCATPGAETSAEPPAGRLVDRGIASHYWQPQGLACERGRFNPHGMTAAHKTLPCGSRVRVVSDATGRHVDVRINDRGPYVRGRVIDLSSGAARRLGFAAKGLDRVKVYSLD